MGPKAPFHAVNYAPPVDTLDDQFPLRLTSGMVVLTDSPRVHLSRRMVLEFLASSVDLSLAGSEVRSYMQRYNVHPERFGPSAAASAHDKQRPGHHEVPVDTTAATVAQPSIIDNNLYMRDYLPLYSVL